MRRAGVLFATLLAGFAAAAAESDGQRAYDAGDYAQAREAWRAAAAHGDAAAELGLGLLYDLGRGVTADPATALAWYVAAGDDGSPEAQFNAAVMYDAGRGASRDAALAATWYGRAAAHGDHRAEYDLGQLYAAGDGVPRNAEAAAAWFAAASAAGLGAATARLAATRATPSGAAGLAPVMPAAPAAGRTVRRSAGAAAAVELVWTVPAEPAGVQFYVELVALGGGRALPVVSAYARTTAWLARLPGAGAYAWRVYAVSGATRQYLPSAWQRFSVAADATDRLARAVAD